MTNWRQVAGKQAQDSKMRDSASQGAPAANTSTWTPLHEPLFRAFWLATLFANIGALMQQTGAAWLMTDLSPSPLLVSLLQAAGSLPVFLLALPAGALADVVDRRRLTLWAQGWMILTTALLALLSFWGVVTPWGLLTLVFLTAVGSTFSAPALQTVIVDLLPPQEVSEGIVLQNVSLNLARAIGPLAAGFLLASIGPWVVFALSTLSLAGLFLVLYSWHPPARTSTLPAERFVGAMLGGVRYVRHSPPLQVALVRGGLFALFASSPWALIPLVARQQLGLGPIGYGVLSGCLGVGALIGAALRPRLRSQVPIDAFVAGMSVVFAVVMLALGHVTLFPLLCIFLVAGGVAWLSVFSTLSIAAQSAAPLWVKGRSVAIYSLIFQGAMTVGSLLWGYAASQWGLSTALTLAAAGLILVTPITLFWRLDRAEGLDVSPSGTRPAPVVAMDVEEERGPVMVTVEYRVTAAQVDAFVQTMREIENQRYRDGAFLWGLFEDVAQPGRFVEFFGVESWVEHLRQHERVTVSDRDVEERANAFHTGPEPPLVSHFVAERAAA